MAKKVIVYTRTKEHPEQKYNEIFLRNCNGDESYNQINYKFKRKGQWAYDVSGKIIRGSFPVFVSENEYMGKMREAIRKKLKGPNSYGY